jgi:hypothetical protein
MALVSKEKYDPMRVEKQQEYLRLYSEKGRPIDYEVIVDGLKAVRRTNDPEDFMDYQRFIGADTKTVEVVFFTGTSNNHDRYIFTLSEEKEGLNGLEIDARIAEQVDRQKRDWQYASMEKENSDLKREVAELEKEIEQLEADHKALQDQQSPFKGLLGDLGSTFVESFIRRNPAIMKSIPGGEALSGLINVPDKAQENSSEGSVSFRPRNDSAQLTEDQQAAVSFVEQLKIQFTKPEFDRVVTILQALADDKQRIEVVINTVVNSQV